ncbi:hypothetical protein VYU27_006474 [Nannochloropsis oceanica]
MDQARISLLSNEHPFDVALLDNVVTCSQNPSDPNRQAAHQLMMEMQQDSEMWKRVDAVLERSTNPATRFFGLQILEDTIKTRWKILPAEEREGIKNYIVGKVVDISKDDASMAAERLFLNKLNMALVQVLKQEWPHNWPSFISDIVQFSQTSEVLCENNVRILKLLSEEVFDFSKDQMTTAKIKTLKESLQHEFAKIFELLSFILSRSQRPSLIKATLQTLQRFLTWIPLAFIFETSLIQSLIDTFFVVPAFRVETLECLTEIASLQDLDPQYEPLYQKMFLAFLTQLQTIIPPDSDLSAPFHNQNEVDCLFIQRLALFFCNFFRLHLQVLEVPECRDSLLMGMVYLVRISEVPEEEVFKICLDYWHVLAQDLYMGDVQYRSSLSTTTLAYSDGSGNGEGGRGSPRKQLYAQILSRVRVVFISRMAKPEEVLVVEDEAGNIVREQTKDTEVIAQYKTMREALVYFTHLDQDDTESIMLEKLAQQVDGTEWSWNNLNTLCWAIGSISGAMGEEEKRFLVTVIKDLLGLCEMKRGKDNKAVVASNIMYVVGQYPRFLRAPKHWKFLRTVVTKLFEFMHEKHPGVQDMACDTYLKIAQKCKRKFVTVQANESAPYIEELVAKIGDNTSDLEPHQIYVFYEATGTMLSERGPQVSLDRVGVLAKLMDLPNSVWRGIMAQAASNVQVLLDAGVIRELTKILKTNAAVCASVGPLYVHQLGVIFLDLLNLYSTYSSQVAQAVATQGQYATRMSNVRAMRGIKKEILRLLTTFIEKSGEPESTPAYVAQQIMPPILEPVLTDYRASVPEARDAEVLTLFAAAVEKLGSQLVPEVPRILDHVLEVTLDMINKNFEDFPEHRLRFYALLKAVNNATFEAILQLKGEHQKLVVDAVVWGMKHTDRNIAEMALEILFDLLQNVGRAPEVAPAFYQAYLPDLISDIFVVMTDRLHKSGFKMHATLLRQIFTLIELGQVTAPLFDTASQPPEQTNQQFMRESVLELLSRSFPNLTRTMTVAFVSGLFDQSKDLAAYKTHLRDFLVQLKEFSVEDNSDLFHEEAALQRAQQEEQQRASRLAVPGMVNPYDAPDQDMGDL